MPVIVRDKENISPEERAAAMAEFQAVVSESPYGDSPLRAYIIPMDRISNSKGPRGWTSTLSVKPYMETAGRLVAAHEDSARPILGVYTSLNPSDESVEFTHFGVTYQTPPRHARAVLRRLIAVGSGWHEQQFTAVEAIRGGDRGVNATHPLANAETSAIGRVLGVAGYGNLPGSSISPAETMAATPQDDERAAARPRRAAAPATVELSMEELEACVPFAQAIGDAQSADELRAVGTRVSQDTALTERMRAYLQVSYVTRREELKVRDKAASEATEAHDDAA